MKILNKQTIKVNNNNSISILTLENDMFEIAHLENGKYSETILNDVVRVNENELSEKVEEIATEIVTKTLKEEFEAETVEGSIQIETFTYDIWIDVMFEKNKITYACETSHNGRRYDCDDFRDSVANRQTRSTFKGLVNYIKRFEDR